ncbi:hypothetical protein N7520_006069 [Penicillium odoratum]|uniref:uncharacterized protein n=1 Tax=Penicillium odoratum TaxID=1167516 RepID=UPI0025484C5F|nr:uncharacterized protein N7520_006069 [Penicillium odoratum]KAJ5758913.1 hypothetical protein N7520_006069 [Penicillium odoratum]
MRLTHPAPWRERTQHEGAPERSCPTEGAYYWHKFDLEYHWAIDERDFESAEGWSTRNDLGFDAVRMLFTSYLSRSNSRATENNIIFCRGMAEAWRAVRLYKVKNQAINFHQASQIQRPLPGGKTSRLDPKRSNFVVRIVCSKANLNSSGGTGPGLERASIGLGLMLKFANGMGFRPQGYDGDREYVEEKKNTFAFSREEKPAGR